MKRRKMMPIGPLMIEHRLIEKMIGMMSEELERMKREKTVRPSLIDTMVDFIRTYADRCHHGKEEDILFRELAKKDLKAEHAETMNELIEEHKWGRATTKRLVEASRAYEAGDREAVSTVARCLEELAAFYPKHIEKEDKRFFKPVMDYFTQEQRDAMLEEGFDFDRNLIHEKYRKMVEQTGELFG